MSEKTDRESKIVKSTEVEEYDFAGAGRLLGWTFGWISGWHGDNHSWTVEHIIAAISVTDCSVGWVDICPVSLLRLEPWGLT
jgi:hypothetical protein